MDPASQGPSFEMPTLLAVLQQLMSQPSHIANVDEVEESAIAHQLAWLVLTSLASSSQPVAGATDRSQQQQRRSTLAHNNALLAEELAALHAGLSNTTSSNHMAPSWSQITSRPSRASASCRTKLPSGKTATHSG